MSLAQTSAVTAGFVSVVTPASLPASATAAWFPIGGVEFLTSASTAGSVSFVFAILTPVSAPASAATASFQFALLTPTSATAAGFASFLLAILTPASATAVGLAFHVCAFLTPVPAPAAGGVSLLLVPAPVAVCRVPVRACGGLRQILGVVQSRGDGREPWQPVE